MNVIIGFAKACMAKLDLEEDYLLFLFLKYVHYVESFEFYTRFPM